MKALVIDQEQQLKEATRPEPEAGPGEVLCRVVACGICRTDIKLCKAGHRDLVLPRIPGHEMVVLPAGENRLFAVWPGQACGNCDACNRGAENLCPAISIFGFNSDGGWAEAIAVPERALLPVPDTLSAPAATLAEPLACAIHACHQGNITSGMSLLVVGAGPLGLLLALAANARGACVRLVEQNDARWHQSRSFRKLHAMERVDPKLGTYDAAINAAATPEAFTTMLSSVRPGGTAIHFSGLMDDISRSQVNTIHYRELSLVGSYGCTREDMKEALDLLTVSRADLLIDRQVPLAEAPDVMDGLWQGQHLKCVINLHPA